MGVTEAPAQLREQRSKVSTTTLRPRCIAGLPIVFNRDDAREQRGRMSEQAQLARVFEVNRPRLRAIAYRMLGSLTEADDAVQEAWLRLSRSDAGTVESLGNWLSTVVARVCLDTLRARTVRAEEPFEARMPEPILAREDRADPEQEALLADAVGLALQVVLEKLAPPERLSFVLHDLFAVPFEEIAKIVGRSPAAARQLASRGRRRVRGATVSPDVDVTRQRAVIDAFLAAAHGGDPSALLAVLDPTVVLTDGSRGRAASRLEGGARRAGRRPAGAPVLEARRLRDAGASERRGGDHRVAAGWCADVRDGRSQ